MPILDNTSVAEEYMFIKEFDFDPRTDIDVFTALTFSDTDKIRLSGSKFHIRLKKDSDGNYPLDTDIWARTWTTNPKSLRRLEMVQVFSNADFDDDIDVQLRIYDGSDDYYWDGAAWSVAGVGDWNTETEINAHITTFNILPDRTFAITLNLSTVDVEKTPIVTEVRVLMRIRIDYIEDLIYRSLIPFIKANVRPLANFPLPALTADSITIDLNNYNLDTNFNIVDVEAVFDFSSDSELLCDLLDNYNTTTKVITLTSTISTGNIPFILFRYEPEVVYTTSQDFLDGVVIDDAQLPAIILERVEIPVESDYNLGARETIVDKGTYRAVIIPAPFRATFEFRVHGCTDKGTDEFRLMSALLKFLEANKFVTSIGLDESYSMILVKEIRDLNTPNRADEHTFWTMFNILNVRMPMVWEEGYAIKRRIITFKEPMPAHEDPVKGGARIVLTSHEDDGPFAWEEEIILD